MFARSDVSPSRTDLPEMGQLVCGFDFRPVTEQLRRDYVSKLSGSIALLPLLLDGQAAKAGRISPSGGEPANIDFDILGGLRHLFIVEGEAKARVFRHWEGYKFLKQLNPEIQSITPDGDKPVYVPLPNFNDFVQFYETSGPDNGCWVVAINEQTMLDRALIR